jgi:hypothetical protein
MKYLINLDAHEVCAKNESTEELEAIGKKNTWAYHVCSAETFAGCTLADLAKYYNNLPGAKEKVARFSDRNAGIRRLNETIERGGLNDLRTGKKAVKVRKKRSDGSNAGRRSGWETVSVSAAGKADELRFHKDNPRFKVFEVIKRREEVGREALVKFCEESLSVKRPQVMGAVAKLVKRGLAKVK